MSEASVKMIGVTPRRPLRVGTHSAWLRWSIAALGVLALLLAAFFAGGAWYFSSRLDATALDAAAKRTASTLEEHTFPIRVMSVDRSDSSLAGITLKVPAKPDVLLTDGTWGLEGPDGGFGQITAIEHGGGGLISREYRHLSGPPIVAGENVRLVHPAFPEDPAAGLGISNQNVEYQGPLGSYPAWFIPGTAPNWAILVHGNSLRRGDMMRFIAPIHRAGLPMLVITYRNDPTAPADPSGKLRYGLAEWQDLEAAVGFARSHGARHVVLVGVSMGGGIVLSFLYRSALAADVSGVVLDSPMLDFSRTVDFGASHETLPVIGLPVPGPLVSMAKWISGWRFGVDWGAVNYLARDSELRAPILLFQGTADQTVPPATSAELAADRPDLVTYVVTPGAGHVDSWNLNPSRHEQLVQDFTLAHGHD